MTECFYNKFHPTLPQCKNEGEPLGKEFFKAGNGTDSWTWCKQHQTPFTRDAAPCPLCGRTDPHTHTAGPWGMT